MTKPIQSRSSVIENHFFGEGYYNFRLGVEQLKRLQELTNFGAVPLYNRFASKEWFVEELQETIRLGLIGGGTDPKTAFDLTKTYVCEG